MSYDKPHRISYFFADVDFGTGADHTQAIPVPTDGSQGRSGMVTDIVISDVTEDFVGTTTSAGVQVGNGTDADKYYDTGLPLDSTVDIADNASLWLIDDGSKVAIELTRSTLTVTFVQGVGGSITGIASVTVFVDGD